MAIRVGDYDSGPFFDELIDSKSEPRPYSKELCEYLQGLSDAEIKNTKQRQIQQFK